MTVDWKALLGETSLWLAIVALLFACVQLWQARRQAKRLKQQGDALGLITESLSTRYIGPFPEYLSSVIDLVETAERELKIVNGNPTPAYFSAPRTWMDYSHAIERRARSGIAVRVVCGVERQRRQRLAQQFPTSNEEWRGWITKNHSKVREFLRFRYPDTSPEDLDHSTFLDSLLATQRDMLRQSLQEKGVKVLEIAQVVPVQVWIADKSRAVFCLQSLRKDALGHGVFTSDPRFVAALHSMLEFYESSEVTAVAGSAESKPSQSEGATPRRRSEAEANSPSI